MSLWACEDVDFDAVHGLDLQTDFHPKYKRRSQRVRKMPPCKGLQQRVSNSRLEKTTTRYVRMVAGTILVGRVPVAGGPDGQLILCSIRETCI